MDKVELETIEFVNKGDVDFETKKEPINATNLNQLQSNTNNALSKLQDNIANILNNINKYSTDEKIIGTYIDGKPLYKKTFQVTTSATLNAFNDIYSANIENVPSLHFQFRKGNERYPENHQQFSFYVVNGILKEYHTNGYYSEGELTVTLKYTKTTDSGANS